MTRRLAALLIGASIALGCTEQAAAPTPTLTREELMDPQTCKGCHPKHYEEWSSSMHAYASKDPVFRAMNALGQEETDGGLNDFCVKCHAPMALNEGATENGMNLDDVPKHLQGITCYFCHNVTDVVGEHNAELKLANDTTMRGALDGAVRPSAHGVSFSRFMDRNNPDSNKMCGGCHDIQTPNGVHLERTYAEYKAGFFSKEGPGFQSCTQCHMRSSPGLAAVDPNSPVRMRDVHEHLWAGVDIALTDWPHREAYEQAVTCALDRSVRIDDFSVLGGVNVTYTFSNETGHGLPSGASQDRRFWVELVAQDADGNIACTKGAVPDDEAADGFVDPRQCDADGAWLFFDRLFDENGDETHQFWRAAPSDEHDAGFTSGSLAAAVNRLAPHYKTVTYQILNAAKITIRLRMRPMDYDALAELVDTGKLDPEILEHIPTFTLMSSTRVWNAATDTIEKPEPEILCPDAYECDFDPTAPGCGGAE